MKKYYLRFLLWWHKTKLATIWYVLTIDGSLMRNIDVHHKDNGDIYVKFKNGHIFNPNCDISLQTLQIESDGNVTLIKNKEELGDLKNAQNEKEPWAF